MSTGKSPCNDSRLGGEARNADVVKDTLQSLSRSQRAAAELIDAMDDFEATHANEPIQGSGQDEAPSHLPRLSEQ